MRLAQKTLSLIEGKHELGDELGGDLPSTPYIANVRRFVRGDSFRPYRLQTLIQLNAGAADLTLRDMDGDGDLDLVHVDSAGLAVFSLGGRGRYPRAPTALMKWPVGRTAWTVADIDGTGAHRVLTLTGDGRVFRHDFDGKTFQPAVLILEDEVFLPPGITAMDFCRDVDGNGVPDLVLPTRSAHHVHLANGAGFDPPLIIAFDLSITLSTGSPGQLGARVGRQVSVPKFRMYDLDGDGEHDLISQTRERVAVHLAGEAGLPTEPTWVMDLVALQAELPESQGLNFDDLLANVDEDVSWALRDLDGVAPRDLIVVLGSQFRVYLGGSHTGPRAKPDQILKASGKVLGWFVRQVRGDAQLDLQIVRGERISLGRVLRYLILPGKLDFDIFTYTNSEGTFSRKPTQRGQVSVEIPRLLPLIEEAEEIGKAVIEQLEIPARRLAWGGHSETDDVVDIEGDTISVYLDCAPEEDRLERAWDGEPDVMGLLEVLVLEDLDALGDQGNVTLKMSDLFERDFSAGAALRRGRQGKQAHWALEVPGLADAEQVILLPTDLTGSGSDDLVLCSLLEDHWTVQVWVRD
jgi:hypothetical protein